MRSKAQYGRNLLAEGLKSVISAAADKLPRTAAERDGLAIVEELVAGFDQQEDAVGSRDARTRIDRSSAKCPVVTSKAAPV